MRMMWGIVIAGVVVVAANVVMITLAFGLAADDAVVDSYDHEAR